MSVVLDKHISLMQRFVARPAGRDERLDGPQAPQDTYHTQGVNDGYEPYPKDPKDDFEKEQRIAWLKTEIDRIRGLLAGYTARSNEIASQLNQISNDLYSLRNDLDRVNYNISGVQGYMEDCENKKLYYKQQLYNGPPNEREYWRKQLDYINDEISRGHSKLQELNWQRNDINYKIREKQSSRESLTRDKYYYDNEIQKERYNLKDREDELRRLQGW